MRSEQLLAAVTGARRSRPDVAALLARLAADHRAHRDALRATTAAASATPTATTTTAPTSSTAPAKGSPDLRPLAAAERAASAAAVTDLAVVGPSTARLLASVAASLQTHASLLAPVARPR